MPREGSTRGSSLSYMGFAFGSLSRYSLLACSFLFFVFLYFITTPTKYAEEKYSTHNI